MYYIKLQSKLGITLFKTLFQILFLKVYMKEKYSCDIKGSVVYNK